MPDVAQAAVHAVEAGGDGVVESIGAVTDALLYAADGWDTGGAWNYTWQNRGVYVLFTCGCLLAGVLLAVWKERRNG